MPSAIKARNRRVLCLVATSLTAGARARLRPVRRGNRHENRLTGGEAAFQARELYLLAVRREPGVLLYQRAHQESQSEERQYPAARPLFIGDAILLRHLAAQRLQPGLGED